MAAVGWGRKAQQTLSMIAGSASVMNILFSSLITSYLWESLNPPQDLQT